MADLLPEFLDDDHAAIVQFAESYMDEDERDDFIDTLMERRGYQRVTSWGPGDPKPKPPARRGGQQRPPQRQQRPSYFKR